MPHKFLVINVLVYVVLYHSFVKLNYCTLQFQDRPKFPTVDVIYLISCLMMLISKVATRTFVHFFQQNELKEVSTDPTNNVKYRGSSKKNAGIIKTYHSKTVIHIEMIKVLKCGKRT